MILLILYPAAFCHPLVKLILAYQKTQFGQTENKKYLIFREF